ncbi:dienelactone hydrolase family protein [Lysobacter niastensis]|uniref:Dienelactone hydrolase family protein n=1 Tax=Lysobacter niastensis TaxID=380629 RepID=A0ABS0B2K6_9GAMM|nr:dienelactone hydrolase family protein [Lysobacter niastensis]MBF6022719.1 dienelactone hydrolase family protein [Lysobacter niastensis]
MRRLVSAASLALSAVLLPAHAAMQANPVEWSIGKDSYTGILVYDDANAIKRPGLVMVPDWKGITPAAIERARQFAGDDYVVLVADMYGTKIRPKNDDEAGKVAGPLRDDRPVLRARMEKAVDVLKAQAGKAPVDATRVGAFGFCFGGTSALELVRGGSEVAGVVSFHGALSTPLPAKDDSARTPALVLNGADDRSVTDEDIASFEKEMDAAGADWQFVNFSGAVHCFAVPEANNPPGCVYDPKASRRAEKMMRDFFDERFAAARP